MNELDLFLHRRTIPVDGQRTSLAALFGEFGKTLLPGEAERWTRAAFADALRDRAYPVGLVEGRPFVGNLLLIKHSTYVETGPVLRKVEVAA